jgi:hypothetical protein
MTISRRAGLAHGLLLSCSLLVLAATSAHAADKVIASGVTTTGVILSPGDTLTVEKGGALIDTSSLVTDMAMGHLVISNKGIISATGAVAIYVTQSQLDIDNSGAIASDTDGAISAQGFGTLTNSGTISGKITIHGGKVDALANSGTITGQQYAVDIDTVTKATNSGTIQGGIDGVRSLDLVALTNTGLIAGGTHNGISINGATGAITNAKGGSITGGDNGIEGTGALGQLINAGIITGNTSYALFMGGDVVTIDNSGTMQGTSGAIASGGTIGRLNNSGTITAGTDDAVVSAAIGTVNNTGAISGGTNLASAGIRSGSTITAVTNAASGTISGVSGIRAVGAIGSVSNAGTINGGVGGAAVRTDTTIGSVTNAATGKMVGDYGVFATGAIGSVTNAGTMTGTYGGVFATNGTLGSLVNTGTITGTQVGGVGGENIASLVNSGRIAGSTFGVGGVNGIGSLTNSGTIIASGANSVGVMAFATDIDGLVNSGTIQGERMGIMAMGRIASLTNSGTIRAATPADFAIAEAATLANDDTILTLNAGSILIGRVAISDGNDTLHVGNGLNLALTFDTSVPELIETDGSPYVVLGNTVYVADTANIEGGAAATADLTAAIGSAVSGAASEGFAEKGVDGQGRYWLQGIGGLNAQPGDLADSRFGGFIAGGDFAASEDARFGFYLGGSRGFIDAGASTTNADSAYAGLYGTSQFEDFAVDGALTAGYTHSGNRSTVADNTVATGLRTETSSQDGFFISPGITFTKPWVTEELTFTSSLAFNYTGVFSGGATEAATGLSTGNATSHVFETEALLRLPFQQVTETGIFSGDVHAGIEGRAIVNPSLSGTLAGTQVVFTTTGTTATVGLVAGLSMEYDMGSAKFFGALDGTIRTDSSASLSANAGLKATF